MDMPVELSTVFPGSGWHEGPPFWADGLLQPLVLVCVPLPWPVAQLQFDKLDQLPQPPAGIKILGS